MSIKPDWWIRQEALKGMIEPFEDRLVREGVISYGLSSFGYDLRAAPEWRVFVNAFNTVVDPKNFDLRGLVEIEEDHCIIPPNSFVLTRSVEYLRIPRDVMVVALGKSSYARCFSGDTRVALVDGSAVTLEEMATRSEDMFFGYSVGPHGRVVVTRLESPRYVGRDNLLEITLDNGEAVHATPDHDFMTRDGRMVEAAALSEGDALMPLYRSLHRGYEMVYQPLNGFNYPTHRLADEWNLRHGIYADEPNTHRHHIDHNRRNNAPWNIERMDGGEHLRYHNTFTYGADFDAEEHSLSVREALERRMQSSAWRERHAELQSERALSFWQEERHTEMRSEMLKKRRAFWQTTQAREAQRLRQADFWQNNSAARRAQGERSREAWTRSSAERRIRQQAVARSLRLREDITAVTVREALDTTGSIRGAARLLGCDRSVFRRFPEVIQAFRGLGAPADPSTYKNHKVRHVRALRGEHDVYCLTVPEAGNFALAAGAFVANCGIVANVTPLEPGWEGHVTLELSNTTPLPAKVYANEGIVQLLFFQGDQPEVTYADRKGKYQGQRGVTLPKL